jgi:hypothetical protein
MSRDINPFGLRMPPALKEEIEAAARESGRSLNAEIVSRLEDSLRVDVPRLKEFLRAEDLLDKTGELTREIATMKRDHAAAIKALTEEMRALHGAKPRSRKR